MYREETQHFHSKCILEREREREREGNMACLLIIWSSNTCLSKKKFIFFLKLVQQNLKYGLEVNCTKLFCNPLINSHQTCRLYEIKISQRQYKRSINQAQYTIQ